MAESSANPKAVSRCGARGLFQLMPITATEMRANPDDPEDSIRAGTEYLARQLSNVKLLLHGVASATHDDLLRFALASYNCGFGYVRRAIKMALEAEQPVTWGTVSALLPKAEVNGRTADVKQVTGYVAKILSPP